MKFSISIRIIVVVHLYVYCRADVHTFGIKVNGLQKIYSRVLIDDANKVPKDYTLIYKCLGIEYKQVDYLEINVNVNSTGYVNESNERKDFDAKIQINNALNVTATIEIYVSSMSRLTYINRWIQSGSVADASFDRMLSNKFESKSLTFIYKKKTIKSLIPKPFFQNAIGRRRKGDNLLYFESRNITNVSRFPSRAFEYSGNEYITYVGFSFNSPTAMVMINTSYVGEQEFNAVAYDMNTEHFVANMSVYGIRSLSRPFNFEGVI